MPSFDALPAEVRINIYRMLFDHTILNFTCLDKEYIYPRGPRKLRAEVIASVGERSENGSELALLFVSKLVYRATRELWLQHVHFKFAHSRLLLDKIGGLSIHQRRMIRFITVIPGTLYIHLPFDLFEYDVAVESEEQYNDFNELGAILTALPGLQLEHLVVDWRVGDHYDWLGLQDTMSLIRCSSGWKRLSIIERDCKRLFEFGESGYISENEMTIVTHPSDPHADVEVYGGLASSSSNDALCITESCYEKFPKRSFDHGFQITLPSMGDSFLDSLEREVMFVATHGCEYDCEPASLSLLNFLQPYVSRALDQTVSLVAMDWKTLVQAEKQYAHYVEKMSQESPSSTNSLLIPDRFFCYYLNVF